MKIRQRRCGDIKDDNRAVRLTLFYATALVCAFAQTQTVAAAQTDTYLDVGGSRIWYEECGRASHGPAVVLLHDGLVHSITWDGVWSPLCSQYHVVRYDRRGYGRSEPAKAAFRPEDDLKKIMNQVGMGRAIIVGNSSGGGLAIDFALAHPEMVEALFLIGPVVHGMASSDYFNQRGSRNSAPLAKDDWRSAAKNWSQDRFLVAGEDPDARRKLYDALIESPQNLRVAGEFEIRTSPPTVLRLHEIEVPTLVVVGDADIGDVFAYAGAIEAAVPLASFEIWNDTGHLVQLQRPSELLSRFSRFAKLADRNYVELSRHQLGEYAGQYKVGNDAGTVTLRERHLVLEIPGQPYYRLFAASDTKFFLRTEETDIEFQRQGEHGKIVEMVIHNVDGSVIHCPRVEVINGGKAAKFQ